MANMNPPNLAPIDACLSAGWIPTPLYEVAVGMESDWIVEFSWRMGMVAGFF